MSQPSLKQIAAYAADQVLTGLPSRHLSRQLAGLLSSSTRTSQASKLINMIEIELNKRGKVQVDLNSTYPLSDETKGRVARALGASTAAFSETLDESLIGGLRASTLDKELDLSISSKLKSLRVNGAAQ